MYRVYIVEDDLGIAEQAERWGIQAYLANLRG